MSLKRILFYAVIVYGIFNWGTIRDHLSPPPDFSANYPEGVVLYSTEWCGYCRKARAFFEANNVPFIELDIEKSPEGRAQYEQLGGGGIPLVIIRGKVLKGFNPSAYAKHLQLR